MPGQIGAIGTAKSVDETEELLEAARIDQDMVWLDSIDKTIESLEQADLRIIQSLLDLASLMGYHSPRNAWERLHVS